MSLVKFLPILFFEDQKPGQRGTSREIGTISREIGTILEIRAKDLGLR